ncbi:UbiD family decarboxylase [Devosia sp. XJ19-1]|uniref:UbiD family decarboxylase n=1 Tax=Devosia ureilytica TaxID=2952754 RepID=A0A9Q4APR5_9HYPH|nr:UbiD family decarboxylase [Devosia ureilytica]MCP8884486.1 UbiD family decarboxylase [Devosia ureilytica]MCP8888094.1 UbiD family decarboxylase [Devosia ureilytica]
MPNPLLPPLRHPIADNLAGFMHVLERRGLLHRINRPVSMVHEVTEIHRRVLADNGPALLLESPVMPDGSAAAMPVLVNLFGTTERVALGLGLDVPDLDNLGLGLAQLRSPKPPRDLRSAWASRDMLRAALTLRTRLVQRPACQAVVWRGGEIDLGRLPIQTCWPGEPAPLITWPLVITRAPDDPSDINVGIYRMQVLGRDRAIVRWLPSRGGARHHRLWQQKGLDMPIAIAIGADPVTILAAVMPLPDGLNEMAFSGVLRRRQARLAHGVSVGLPVPAEAEIVLEGSVSATETAAEGPYGDHTGYYNSVESFPVVRLSAITMRRQPVYLSTYTGRPPDEPSRLGEAMTPLFVPLAKEQFPEIKDLWLPPEACSYRAMVVSIDKRYPGQARRLMMGLWSMLPQFSMTKLIIVVDPDINVRDWGDVMWALSTRFDAMRDLVVIPDTPIDYLDFASPRPGLGGKLGLDATNKIASETDREWGRPLAMSNEITDRVDGLWSELGLRG